MMIHKMILIFCLLIISLHDIVHSVRAPLTPEQRAKRAPLTPEQRAKRAESQRVSNSSN